MAWTSVFPLTCNWSPGEIIWGTETVWDDDGIVWDLELLQAEEGFYDFAQTELTGKQAILPPPTGALRANSGIFWGNGAYFFGVTYQGTSTSGKWITKYALSVLGDLSTAVLSQSIQMPSTFPISTIGIDISPDGLNLYFIELNAQRVWRYTLGSPGDLNTISVNDLETLSVSYTPNTLYYPVSIKWNSQGTRFLVAYAHYTSAGFGFVREYVATAPFALAGAVVAYMYGESLNRRFSNAEYSGANDEFIFTTSIYACSGARYVDDYSIRRLTLIEGGNLSAGYSTEECFTTGSHEFFQYIRDKAYVVNPGRLWLRESSTAYVEIVIPYVITQEELWSNSPETVWDASCTPAAVPAELTTCADYTAETPILC